MVLGSDTSSLVTYTVPKAATLLWQAPLGVVDGGFVKLRLKIEAHISLRSEVNIMFPISLPHTTQNGRLSDL